jgi:hypothetical protein
MRKWIDQPPHSAEPVVTTQSVEGRAARLRARAFRRWIAGGAEPGGLRALAEEESSKPARKFERSDRRDELRP